MSDYIPDKVTDDVIISKEKYDSLLRDSDELDCLKAGGVDNWDYYSDALRENGFFERWED